MAKTELRSLDFQEMGRRIRAKREFLNMTREDLAEQIDVSSQFISDIEYGHKGLSIRRLYMLCQVLRVSADYVLAGEVHETDGDGEIARYREEILSILVRCNTEQLKGMSQIARIYEDGTRLK